MQNPIRIYNQFLDFQMETDNYISLQFPINFYGIGQFELHINRYAHGADAFEKGNIIVINKRKDKAGMILAKEIALDQSGKATENWKITGYTLNGLLSRRITVPPVDTAYDRKSGNAETVMKHYVNNHFIFPADGKRRMPQLEIAPNNNRGDHVDWESRLKVVSDELESIGKQAGLGWIVYADTKNKKFIFDVMDAIDATKTNNQGHTPVTFSPDFGTVESQNFTDSNTDYKSTAYVGGQGEGVERKIIEVGDEVRGLERIETFVDARDVGNDEDATEADIENELNKRGEKQLSENSRKLYFEAQILTPVTDQINRIPNGKPIVKTPYEYEKDFGIGYVVTVLNKSWGVTMDAQITEMMEIHETSGFRLEATFGEAQPTIIDKINKKFNEITGVGKQEAPAKFAKIQANQAEQNAKNYTDNNAVDKATYNDQVDSILNDLADKAGLDYVNGQLVSKADKADTYTISEVDNALDSKVSITQYTTDQDGIVTRLDDAESSISQNANAITSKVEQTIFDSLEGRVDSAESTISQQADQIQTKIDDGEARSIFIQEADSFTFDANQVNFDGAVFGQDATFSGAVVGATIESNTLVDNRSHNARFNGEEFRFVKFKSGVTNPDTENIDFSQVQSLSRIFNDGVAFADDTETLGIGLDGLYHTGQLDINAQDVVIGSMSGMSYIINDTEVWGDLAVDNNIQTDTLNVEDNAVFNTADYQGNTIFRSTSDHQGGAIFRSKVQVRGELNSSAVYNKTTSSSSNVHVDGNYTIRRVTSAKKYKEEIEIAEVDYNAILNLHPKSWFDKAEVQENNNTTDGLDRHYGLIAEDVEAVGLHQYVTYNDNEVEGIEYDRLWTTLIPVVREMKDEINYLSMENQVLKQKVAYLEEEL
ncbi:hypothetical protein Pryu01_02778 [Paraliobacillus ryukyuensis]|uniref:Endosialidase-like protein n=1 Tax=Paraliobacillus ryukyuensis TaxID=200904 RepID=A0A366DSZ5_9BACI|nr:tail fiber domain-containing protein [Paraliobacillus ryukyuensis]RBO93212.1 endosialidase-like protein [Paraliobacillus ryukyuensis]